MSNGHDLYFAEIIFLNKVTENIDPSLNSFISADEYGMLNAQLALAEARIRQLLSSNEDMKQKITNLQTMVV